MSTPINRSLPSLGRMSRSAAPGIKQRFAALQGSSSVVSRAATIRGPSSAAAGRGNRSLAVTPPVTTTTTTSLASVAQKQAAQQTAFVADVHANRSDLKPLRLPPAVPVPIRTTSLGLGSQSPEPMTMTPLARELSEALRKSKGQKSSVSPNNQEKTGHLESQHSSDSEDTNSSRSSSRYGSTENLVPDTKTRTQRMKKFLGKVDLFSGIRKGIQKRKEAAKLKSEIKDRVTREILDEKGLLGVQDRKKLAKYQLKEARLEAEGAKAERAAEKVRTHQLDSQIIQEEREQKQAVKNEAKDIFKAAQKELKKARHDYQKQKREMRHAKIRGAKLKAIAARRERGLEVKSKLQPKKYPTSSDVRPSVSDD